MVTHDPFEHLEHFSKKQKKEHFNHLVQIAKGDGELDDAEHKLLIALGKKMHFTDEEIDLLINSDKKIPFSPHIELSKRFEQFYDLIYMIIADGKIEEKEMKLLHKFAIKLGFDDNEIPSMMDLIIKGIQEKKEEEELFTQYKKTRKKYN